MKLYKFVLILAWASVRLSSIQAQDPWVIRASAPLSNPYYGITSANGVLGVISSPDPLKVKEVVLAGVYDRFGRGRVSNFLPAFNLLNLKLSVSGETLSSQNINDFIQEFDLHYATFRSSFQYKDQLKVEYDYCALRQLPYSLLLNVKLTALKDIPIICSNVMETPYALKNDRQYFNEIDRPHALLHLLTSEAKSPTGNLTMAASTMFLFSEEKESQPQVIHEIYDSNTHQATFKKNLKAGQSYSFSLVGSVISSFQYADPLNQAERLTIYACLDGKKKLEARHKEAWDCLWKSDIEIEGDAQAQQDIHNMLYHLYAFNRANFGYAPSPMGLSGLGYNGHIFWDSDIWIYPALLLLHPEMAKSMIEYRFKRLEAARQNAFTYGYKGAMYPWESAEAGVEETPVWALTGPFEHHITACVAIAAWNYYLVTRDIEWLREKGWPILKATAEFWCSRVEKNAKGGYEIKNVVAADEWAENVDNDAFTNAAARVNLENAAKCAGVLKLKVPEDWLTIVRNITVHKLRNGVIAEYDGYNGEVIKQADVNLLAYPLGVITDTAQIKKDLAYYEARIPEQDTPAMTQAIFSLLYSRLGNGEKAYHFFKDAYEPNLLSPFRVIAETKGGTNPYFLTGAGGVLQTVMMGFGGLDILSKGGLGQVNSVLPKHWKKLVIKGVGPDKKQYVVINP